MTNFPTIALMLRTAFNVEDGLEEDASIRLYQRAAAFGNNMPTLKNELQEAFSCRDFSWREMLCNDTYEVVDLDTEDEARQFAHRILWEPLFGKS